MRQALISVGSGGLTGKEGLTGHRNASSATCRRGANDYGIFSVIAEEKGFVGSVIVLTLYAVVLFTGIHRQPGARSLGKLLAVGVVTLIFSKVLSISA